MDAELVRLAAAVATAIVQAMYGQHWPTLRGVIANALGRTEPGRIQQALQLLDAVRSELGSDQARAAAAYGRVQGRVEMLLEEHPDAAGELAALVTEIGRSQQPQHVSIQQTTTASHMGSQANVAVGGQSVLSMGHGVIAGGNVDQSRRTKISVGAWIAIVAISIVVLGVLAVLGVLGITALNPGPAYAVGDCVTIEWQQVDRVTEAPVGTGKVSCGQNVRDDNIGQITNVVKHPTSSFVTEYCRLKVAGGDEDWFKDRKTDTIYCYVD